MLSHKGTQTIETQRLILRQIGRQDAQVLFENCFSHPAVTRYLSYETHKDINDTYEIIDKWVSAYKRDKNYHWVITLRQDGMPMGTVTCMDIDESASCGKLGYQLSENMWGNGYMSEALSAVIEYLFNEVAFNRLEAMHIVGNSASGRVMRRCGMQYEGMCRQKVFCSGSYKDVNMYAILKSDYRGGAI